MDTASLHPLLEDLSSNIDDLESSLAPLFQTSLAHSTSKLPLLDKAKLYVLATYAIESVLFSSLRLNGVDAKVHPVFQELGRVKEYFSKIKAAENTGLKRNVTLDKEAAGRFIKHGLAGNDKLDRQRSKVGEESGRKRKADDIAVGTHSRFDGAAKRIRAVEDGDKVDTSASEDIEPAAEVDAASQTAHRSTITAEEEAEILSKAAAKRQRRLERRMASSRDDPLDTPGGRSAGETSSAQDIAKSRDVADTPSQIQAAKGEGKRSKKHKRKAQEAEDARADEMK